MECSYNVCWSLICRYFKVLFLHIHYTLWHLIYMASFQRDNACDSSEWRAANSQLLKHTKLDQTSLEMAKCQPALAQCAVNMYQRELYGYAQYIHQYKMQPANVTSIWVDVIIKYWKWARNSGLLKECLIKPALSMTHTGAHNWTCQVLFDWLKRPNTKFHLVVENSSSIWIIMFLPDVGVGLNTYWQSYCWTKFVMNEKTLSITI